MASVTRFLEGRMKLKVNREKSAVDRPVNRVYLGYSFLDEPRARIRVPEKTCNKMRKKLKVLFAKGKGRNLEAMIQKDLNPVLSGWMNYFRLSETKRFAEDLDSWIRRRLRRLIWQQWKTPAERYRELIRRGLNDGTARLSAGNGRGAWYNSSAAFHKAALPAEDLHSNGSYKHARYTQVSPSHTIHLGTAGCVNRTSGGVGAGGREPP